MKQYQKKKQDQIRIANERIVELFRQADARFREDPKLSNRYVQMARAISTKFRVRFNSAQRKKFCRHCGSYLKAGVNARVRLQQGKQGKVVYYCANCRKYMRFPYKPRKQQN